MKGSIKIILTVFLSIGFAVISYAGYLDDWTDDQICGWMDNASPPEHIVDEAIKRNLDCIPESAKKNAEEEISQKIMIFDADFSQSDLEELSSETLKTDFDFSNFKLAKDHINLECQFYIREVMHDQTGPWTIAEGSLVIDSGEVKIHGAKGGRWSRWNRGGLSTDPKYLRDEVNLRLTEDGYLVGKMAYFEWVGDGELPKLPIYPKLLKHKKSKPLNYKNPTTGIAKFLLEKTLDWSDAILFLTNCELIEENYKDGKLDGKKTTWYQNDQKKSEVNYKNNKRQGKATTWYQSGEIKKVENYKDGKLDGKSTAWYENGQIHIEVNYNGKIYKKNIDGKYTSWYENGQIKTEVMYKDGNKEGKSIAWHENGQIKLELKYNYNKREGKEIFWYNNGQKKSETMYKYGNKEGKSIAWYKNGQKKSEVMYKRNKKEGKETKWHENGQIKSEVMYKDGTY